jgi:hypothetical protein
VAFIVPALSDPSCASDSVSNQNSAQSDESVHGLRRNPKGDSSLGATVVSEIGAKVHRQIGAKVVSEMQQLVCDEVGIMAVPAAFITVPCLPETLTGKYMRRILSQILNSEKKRASSKAAAKRDDDDDDDEEEAELTGDVSMLSNPECIPLIRQAVRNQTMMLRQRVEGSTGGAGGGLRTLY